MTTQLLIYERATPVSKQKHGDWYIKKSTDYSFSKHVNSVPLMAVEFRNAAAEYAIVFTGSEDEIMPAIVLGVRERENLYVSENGDWDAKYVPAFIRRYPFVFSSNDEGKTFTLCIDEEYAGCNQEGRGERLFDADGEWTQYLKGVLDFLKEYQAQFQRTKAFCKKLKTLNLLESMRAQFTLNTGQQMGLSGFMIINRDRLKELPGDQLSELAKTDELELMYLHLQSMRNLTAMINKVQIPPNQAAEE
ncbi:MAG: SapC family protein [Candidatus Hinthialibacter sp.]